MNCARGNLIFLLRCNCYTDEEVDVQVGVVIACVAGGIACAKLRSERRSREKYFKVPLPIVLAASLLACMPAPPPKLYFACAYNTASYAG